MTTSRTAKAKRNLAIPFAAHLATFARHQAGAVFVTILDFRR